MFMSFVVIPTSMSKRETEDKSILSPREKGIKFVYLNVIQCNHLLRIKIE